MLLPRRLRKNRVMIHAVTWRTGMRGRGRAGAQARTCYIHSNICAHMYMYICTYCACIGSVIDARASTLARECEGKNKRGVGHANKLTASPRIRFKREALDRQQRKVRVRQARSCADFCTCFIVNQGRRERCSKDLGLGEMQRLGSRRGEADEDKAPSGVGARHIHEPRVV